MSELNIYQRMSAVTNELRRVAKNLNVGVGKSTYKAVGEADVLDAVKPSEEKYGIYSYPASRVIVNNEILENESIDYNSKEKVIKKQFFMRVETIYRFVNMDKPEEYIETTTYGDGMDSQDKSPGKAMTYADKYALLKGYKIVTGDDPDQNASEDITRNKNQGKTQKVDKVTPTEMQQDTEALKAKPIDDMKIKALESELNRTGATKPGLLKTYKVAEIKDLNLQQWQDAMKKLEKVKDKPKTDLGL